MQLLKQHCAVLSGPAINMHVFTFNAASRLALNMMKRQKLCMCWFIFRTSGCNLELY